MIKHFTTKTYGHDLGLSCTFRQWRATSHCRFLHGYALAFEFVFEANHLDSCNWGVDFGSLKPLKQALEVWFDHKLVVAADDPELDMFEGLQAAGLAQLIVLPNVGCEAFAKKAFDLASVIVNDDRVRVLSVKCSEHSGNSAVHLELQT